jgi:hypothetical protein
MSESLCSVTKFFRSGSFSNIENAQGTEKANNPAAFAFDELPHKIIIESGDSGIVLTMDKWAIWSENRKNSSKKDHRITISYSEGLY